MNKLTSIQIKQEDGTYSEEYPVSVLAENVVWEQGQPNSLVDILGQVSFSTNGSIQHQIDVLDNKKFNTSDLNTYLADQISTDVASWLNTNVNPVGSAVTVDESLSIGGAAADAKKTGDNINNIKNALIRTNEAMELKNINLDLSLSSRSTIINTSDIWSQGGNRHCGIYSIPENGIKIIITANNTNLSSIALLTTSNHDHGTAPDFVQGSKRIIVPVGETEEILLPNECKYLYILKDYQNTVYTPSNVIIQTLDIANKFESINNEYDNIENHLNINDKAIFGNSAGYDFPLTFENGTYRIITVGGVLQKYYDGGYDLTRKVLKSTTFNAPCNIDLTAKDGYLFKVFTAENGIITQVSDLVTTYTLKTGKQYGIILRATDGEENIASLNTSQIIDINYYDKIKINKDTSNNIIEDLYVHKIKNVTSWDSGYISSSDGSLKNSTITCRSNFIYVDDWYDKIIWPDTYDICIFAYNSTSISSYLGKENGFINYEDFDGNIKKFYGKYIRLNVRYHNDNITINPSDINNIYITSNIPTDNTLTMSYKAADAKVTGDKIDQITNVLTSIEVVDMESAQSRTGLINTSNKWSTTSGFYSYPFFVSDQYNKISITAGELNAVVGFLKNSILVNQQTPNFCDSQNGRIVIPPGEKMDIMIPSDCAYIVIMKEGSGFDYTPEKVIFYKWNIGRDFQIKPLGLHEFPPTESALNIVKRCRQMTDIKWTPAVDLPRYMLVQRGGDAVIPDSANTQNYLGTFKAGTEYTGIPYGRVSSTMSNYNYDYATAGHYIDFDTFVSSVANPKSKLCTENISSASGHRSVIYATVCSGLTCYALNVSEVPTARIANISGLSLIGKLNDNGTLLEDSKFKIGDILNKYDYHTAIVTDIIRNNEGTIQFIELSDATTAGLADRNYADGQIGGICRRKGWTREQLFDATSWGEYSLYRYTKNVPYTPSKYVNVGDEFNMQRIEHFPIMPYEGEGFTFKDGYIPNNAVHLVITLDGYNYARVFKDGEEITGSPFVVTKNEQDIINPIDITEIGIGSYSAYLCNMNNGDVTNMTYACHWTVV